MAEDEMLSTNGYLVRTGAFCQIFPTTPCTHGVPDFGVFVVFLRFAFS